MARAQVGVVVVPGPGPLEIAAQVAANTRAQAHAAQGRRPQRVLRRRVLAGVESTQARLEWWQSARRASCQVEMVRGPAKPQGSRALIVERP